MTPYDETHQAGILSVEQNLQQGMFEGDVGIQIAEDGRIWLCFNGAALIRFKPATEKFRKFFRDQEKKYAGNQT